MAVIDVPGQGLVEFPDSMTDDQIVAAIKKNSMTPQQARRAEGQRIYEETVLKNGWGSGLPKAMYELGGKVTDLTGSPGLGAAVNVIPDALQSMLGGNVTAAATKPVTEWGARTLMSSALKPTLEQTRKGKASPAIETMLNEGDGGLFSLPGFNPTASGVEKMKARLSDLGDSVKEQISNSGAMIPTGRVADYVRNAYARFDSGPRATSAIDDLGKVQQEFIEHPMVAGAHEIPIQVAQKMKSGYQQAVGDKAYGELKTPSTEGEKQIARGLRELIGEARPGVKGPLKSEADIINALKMAERRVAIDANKNPIGLGWLAQPWMIPFWMWDRSAAAKGLTARVLENGNYPALLGATGALYPNPRDAR